MNRRPGRSPGETLLARRFTLPGAILAVPLPAILKIVCDRLRPRMAFDTRAITF